MITVEACGTVSVLQLGCLRSQPVSRREGVTPLRQPRRAQTEKQTRRRTDLLFLVRVVHLCVCGLSTDESRLLSVE